jgi:phenylalanyl-tRNA synthetase beta chain
MEDVAIAFGYNNLEKRLPIHATTGLELPINALSDKVRRCLALCGFDEVLTWALLSKIENFNNMLINEEDKKDQFVQLIDPKARDLFEMCRTNLLPGILKILRANIGKEKVGLPLKLFEVGDVVLCDSNSITGARNERRMAAIFCNTKSSGFEVVHGLMDRVMQQNEVEFLTQARLKEEFNDEWPFHLPQRFYSICASDRPSFFPGRQAQILVDNVPVGYFGILHPKVISNFGIMRITPVLVSGVELNLETFLKPKVTKKQSQTINRVT